MFRVVTSNHWEALVQTLHQHLDEAPPASPLEPLSIIVPSLALRRDLTMRMADAFGVCANVQFSFLAQWLWRAMASVVPGIARDTPFDAGLLTWRLDAMFADQRFAAGQARLGPYLEACDEAMRFEFAQRTAQLFEHYTTYRDDWLERWARGERVEPPASIASGSSEHRAWTDDEAWQRALWQRLLQALDMAGEHPGQRFIRALHDDHARARSRLPREIHVMALPAIPKLHLAWLRALAQVIDVHVYVINPSRAYWADIVDERRLAWLQRRDPVLAQHRDTGHPLLAACEPQGDSRLARMQRAILELEAATDGDANIVNNADDSVEIHVAHSLRRELEALHDRLLALFDTQDAPAPHEVLVVTPALDDAAPLIDAVFGAARNERRIAYNITGRARGDDGGAASALLQLLDAGTSRWTADTLMALVQTPLVAQRLGWTHGDLDTLRDWLDTAGMRFGLDAEHRAALDLPAHDAHTLDDALDRLLLGHVLADLEDEFVDGDGSAYEVALGGLAGKLPAARATGSLSALLNSLAGLQQALKAWRRRLSLPRAAAEWHTLLLGGMDQFLRAANDAEHEGLRALRLALATWHAGLRAAHDVDADNMGHGGTDEGGRELSLTVVRLSLEHELEARAQGGVPSGSLSFSSMTSLRHLPYRLIVAIGMNDDAWGSGAPALEFDLMARAPRLGDRQRRLDERNILMDLMLSARERFWVYYTGHSQRDNAPFPPATVIDEWIDALARADGVDPERLLKSILFEHPLQPFSAELFAPDAPPQRRSHHQGYARALQRKAEREGSESHDADANTDTHADTETNDEDDVSFILLEAGAPLLTGPLPTWPEARRKLRLDDLKRFFKNPAEQFLRLRLGIELPRKDEGLRDDEAFTLGDRDRASIARQLMPALRAGADDPLLARHALATGLLPEGSIGKRSFEHELGELRAQAKALGEASPPLTLSRELSFNIEGKPWQLVVDIGDVQAHGLAIWIAGKLNARHRLDAWIQHLALCMLAPRAPVVIQTQTLLVTRSESLRLAALTAADAEATLKDLLAMMARGLESPLPFMPEAAWKASGPKAQAHAAFGDDDDDGGGGEEDDDDEPEEAGPSRGQGPGGKKLYDEMQDPWLKLAWRGRKQPAGDVNRIAMAVFEPLRQAIVIEESR
jgi:exodeoxyribonuclease V gamma subunit